MVVPLLMNDHTSEVRHSRKLKLKKPNYEPITKYLNFFDILMKSQ